MPVSDSIIKAELIPNMQEGWDNLWAYLDMLNEAQVTQPKDAGRWTVKDHVIHLAVWEGSMNDVLQKRPHWECINVSLSTWQSGGIDAINAEIYTHNKDLSWPQVKQQFETAHRELIERIEALSEDDLQRPYPYYQPSSESTDSAAFWMVIASYGHYSKHIPLDPGDCQKRDLKAKDKR